LDFCKIIFPLFSEHTEKDLNKSTWYFKLKTLQG
jgi:hypothetical protein